MESIPGNIPSIKLVVCKIATFQETNLDLIHLAFDFMIVYSKGVKVEEIDV